MSVEPIEINLDELVEKYENEEDVFPYIDNLRAYVLDIDNLENQYRKNKNLLISNFLDIEDQISALKAQSIKGKILIQEVLGIEKLFKEIKEDLSKGGK